MAAGLTLFVGSSASAADKEQFRPNKPRSSKQIRTQLPFHDTDRLVTVDVVDGLAVLEGDIVLGAVEQVEIPNNIARSVAIKDLEYRWPNGVIPYTIEEKFGEDTAHIIEAIEHINSKTMVCLVPRNKEKEYVNFVNKNGCWSYVGRQQGKDGQEISVPKRCGFGSTVHEIVHAIGMWHEQSRSDRDEYVKIKWQNIKEDHKHNFRMHIDDGIDFWNYDCASIMHYPPTAFSKNGQATIEGKNPCYNSDIGQRKGLSDWDIWAINALYPSAKGCQQKLISPPSGFIIKGQP
jgi:astacin